MITKELLDGIRDNQRKGITREILTPVLLQNGWNQNDIEEAYRSLAVQTPFVPAASQMPQISTAQYPVQKMNDTSFGGSNLKLGQNKVAARPSKKWLLPTILIVILLLAGGYFGAKLFAPSFFSQSQNTANQVLTPVAQTSTLDATNAGSQIIPVTQPIATHNYNFVYLGGDTNQKINYYGSDGTLINSFDTLRMGIEIPGQTRVAQTGRVLYSTSDPSLKTTIWIRDVGTDPKKVLTLSSLLVFSSISQDGSIIAYVVSDMNGGNITYKLWRVNADGTNNKLIADIGKILSVPSDGNTIVVPEGWSSDLSTIYVAFIRDKGPFGTFAVDAITGQKKSLPLPEKTIWLSSFSQDLSNVAYASYIPNPKMEDAFGLPPYSINIANLEKVSSEKILESPNDIYSYPLISLDSKSVAYSIQKDTQHSTGLYIVSVENKIVTKIFNETNSGVIRPLAFVSNAALIFDEIIASKSGQTENIYMINTDGTNKKLVTSSKSPGTYGVYASSASTSSVGTMTASQKGLSDYPGYHRNDTFGFEFTYDKTFLVSGSGSSCYNQKTCATFEKIGSGGYPEINGTYLSYTVDVEDGKNQLPKLGALYYTSNSKVLFYATESSYAGVTYQYCAEGNKYRVCFYASDPTQQVDPTTQTVIPSPAVNALLKSALSSFKFN